MVKDLSRKNYDFLCVLGSGRTFGHLQPKLKLRKNIARSIYAFAMDPTLFKMSERPA